MSSVAMAGRNPCAWKTNEVVKREVVRQINADGLTRGTTRAGCAMGKQWDVE